MNCRRRIISSLPNTIRQLNQAIDLRLNERQLESLFLGYAWNRQPTGFLFVRQLDTVSQVRTLRALWANERMQLYFDSYGGLIGHLVWHMATDDDEESMLTGKPPALSTEREGEGKQLWILSVAWADSARQAIWRDVRNLALKMESSVRYIRKQRSRLLAQEIDPRRPDGAIRLNAPVERIPPGLELPPVQLIARRKQREGDVLRIYAGSAGMSLQSRPLERAWRPLMLDQYSISYDASGLPCGIVTWAWIDGRDIDAFTSSAFTCHVSRWRCGPQLVLVDAIGDFQPGLAEAVQRGLLSESALKRAPLLNTFADNSSITEG